MSDSSATPSLYETDPHAWAEKQSAALRGGRVEELDLPNLAEEMAGMARAERRELRNALVEIVIIQLRWDHRPAGRSKAMLAEMERFREEALVCLDDCPSLRTILPDLLSVAYRQAVRRLRREPNFADRKFAAENPYSPEDALSWVPSVDPERLPGKPRT